MAYTPDVRIMPVLTALHECFCAELDKAGLSANCDCALVHGSSLNVAPPVVGKGYAWVGLDNIAPSKTFPNPDTTPSNCPSPLVANVTVGVLRCYAVKAQGESSEDMLKWMDIQMADMAAMRRAILCCANLNDDVMLGIYTPIGPSGGIYGGQWSVTVGEAHG